MESVQIVTGVTIEGPYSDGDYALFMGEELRPYVKTVVYLTRKQMLKLAEELIDRV